MILLSRRIRFLHCALFMAIIHQTVPCDCFVFRRRPRSASTASSSPFDVMKNAEEPYELKKWNQLVFQPISFNNKSSSTTPDWVNNAGLVFVILVVVGLAKTSEPTDPFDEAYGTVSNVIDAAMPSSSTDVVAVVLGEAIAGIIGASFSSVLRSFGSNDRQPLVAEAIADSDYFIARAGLVPLFEAIGLSTILASLGSAFVASVPSQLVKFGSRQKQRRLEEDRSLMELLEAQRELEKEKKRERKRLRERIAALRQIRPEERPAPTVNVQELRPVTESGTDFDMVEVFSDVTRWLEYGVLSSDFENAVAGGGSALDHGVSGAIFGFIAAFSSKLYGDVLYGIFRYGPEAKQQEVRTRSITDWITIYASSSVSAAALFGVYEGSQGPISRWIQGTLAGGFDGCLGSESFEACFDTYIQANSPGPTPEAQARALVTNLVMLGQRLQDIAGDTTGEDCERLGRAWAVSAVSYFNSFF